ncbi:MAG TPA: hypothetical protein VFD91_11845, partial [Mariniphaga sp.]|nr:hypothetical protein [Mariniphaga sp.]
MKLNTIILIAVFLTLFSCASTNIKTTESNDVIIENEQVRLILGSDGIAKSLIYKPANEECLVLDENVPAFTVTQERPFNNEVKLAHPNKRTTFFADTLYREGDKLIVGFEVLPYEAVITVTEKHDYISFRLEDFIIEP